MTGLRTRGGLDVGHNFSILHPSGWKPLGPYPPRTNLFTNPAFTATRTPLVVAYNQFINPVLGNATPQTAWSHNLGGGTATLSVMSSGGVDPAVPFRRMHFDTDSTSTGTFGQYVGSATANTIPVTAGLAYSASIWVRHDLAIARYYTFYIQYYNASNGSLTASSNNTLVQPNTWTRLKFDNSVAPANAVRMIVMAYVSGAVSANNGTVPAGSDLDMTMPNVDQSVAVQEFFSGASTGTDYVYAWGGTPHASLSTKSAGAVVSTNLCTNPGAETATGWTSNNGSVCPADRDTAVKHSGTQSCRGTVVSGNSLLTAYAVGFGTAVAGYAAATVGRWYTASLWFYTNVANALHQVQIRFVDGAYANVGNAYSTNVALPAGVWTKAIVSLVAPTGAAFVGMSAFVTRPSATPGMNAWADDACLQEGVGIDTFDGYTASGSDFVYAWSGVANASTSNKIAKTMAGPASGNAWPVSSTMWPGHDRSVRMLSQDPVATGSGYYEIANETGGAVITTPLQRGVTYRASVLVYVDPANPVPTANVAGLTYGESGTGVSAVDLLSAGFYGERQLSATFTVSTDVAATSWRVRLANGHIKGALSMLWFDSFILETSPPDTASFAGGSYFDGATPDDTDYQYAWTGAADASMSSATYP